MSDIVVDSSVVAKWILPEVDSAQAQRVVTDTLANGGKLIVLDLAYPEVANAIWKRHHRGLTNLVETRKALDYLLQSPVHVEACQGVLRPALEVSAKYHRAIYDALFVALAQSLGLTGVTADEPLYKAVHEDIPHIRLLRDW